MDEEKKQEQNSESDECCGDKRHWRKHHHKHRNVYAGPAMGSIWCIGWLFTLGYLHIPFFWKGVLAIIIWPYYLGQALAH